MRTLNDYFLTAEIEDISTASSTFVAVPDGGKIIKILLLYKVLYQVGTLHYLLKSVVQL